jgi:hypothetical protein
MVTGTMAKRLSDDVLRREGAISEGQLGRQLCRNCGGAIVLNDAGRDANVPQRRVCRTCGSEYGTTRATLYPARSQYSNVPEGFYSNLIDQPSHR